MSQRREKFAWPFEDFGNRVDKSLAISRLMAFDWGLDRRHDIGGTAAFRKKDFNTRARGFCGLNENEFVFVR